MDAPGTSDALPDEDLKLLRSNVACSELNSRLEVVNSVSLYSAEMTTQLSKKNKKKLHEKYCKHTVVTYTQL